MVRRRWWRRDTCTMMQKSLRLLAGVLFVAPARGAASSYTFLGCFKDSEDGRVLLSNKQVFDDLSPDVCQKHCLGLNLLLFGLQDRNECWCGSDGAIFETHGEGSQFCDLECGGDGDAIICGGHSAFSLYKTEVSSVHKPGKPKAFRLHEPGLSELASSSAKYLGCFADDENDRVFFSVITAKDVTPEACVQYCARFFKPLSATQNGNECWCGGGYSWKNWLPYGRHGPGNCNYACSGDAELLCGGHLSFSLYETADSGTDPCDPSPCLNGGACSVDPAGGHICTCATGYGGMSCQTDTSGLAEFYIEFEDNSGYNDAGLGSARLARLRSAAARWEAVISHTPCGGHTDYPEYPDGCVHIKLSTSVALPGSTHPKPKRDRFWLDCDITATGSFIFDTPKIYYLDDDEFEELVFHQIGYILGIGYAWQKCTPGCNKYGDSEYTCPSAAAAYNDLAGNEQGAPAIIVGQADKYGLVQCKTFSPDKLGPEAMVGTSVNFDRFPLSKITVAALEDLGYIVDASKAEEYYLPA